MLWAQRSCAAPSGVVAPWFPLFVLRVWCITAECLVDPFTLCVMDIATRWAHIKIWAALDFHNTVGRHAAEVRQCVQFYHTYKLDALVAPRQPPELDSLEVDDWTQPHPGTLGSAHWCSCELLLGWTGSRWLASGMLPSKWQEACFLFRQEGHQCWWWPPAPSSAISWQGDKLWKIKDASVQSRLDNQEIPPMQHIWTIIYQNIFGPLYTMSVIKCNNFL